MTSNSSFKVPDDYFSSLEKRIVVNIKEKEERKHYLRAKVYPRYVALSSIVVVGVVAVCIGVGLPVNKTKKPLAVQKPLVKEIQSQNTQTPICNNETKVVPAKVVKAKKTKETANVKKVGTKDDKQSQENSIKLTQGELEYLGSYLQGDILNDYLAYY
jgi:hypothetical protein